MTVAATGKGSVVMDVRNIGMTFGDGVRAFEALRGISLQISEGEFISLVGPSGCGKSTLLQILGGLLISTKGSVHVTGRKVSGPLPGEIAIVFQEAMLLPWKSALANVEYPLGLQGVPKNDRAMRAKMMLDLVGLSKFVSHFPHQLSGGMKQRVSLARCLAQQPRIILMDEPFGALDEQTRIRMGRELLRIWDQARTTVLLVTHSLTEAIYLSDKVWVMGGGPGRIIECIDVPLERPRRIEMIGSEQFGRLRNHLWGLLDLGDGDPAASGEGAAW